MKPALRILAGPAARAQLRERGLAPADVLAIPGAAGGPKGLILNPLDRFVFGHWLAGAGAPVHLLGASIGAWRMASACLPDADAELAEMARHYIEESYLDAEEVQKARASGRPVRQPGAAAVSRAFRARLASHLGGRSDELLHHPRYRLHLFTSRGVHPLLRRRRPSSRRLP
ncbi:MAG: phospholipase, partial [Proteobacteria bacterium]|nr:phospholipase [Pseudomonadota bacterium]